MIQQSNELAEIEFKYRPLTPLDLKSYQQNDASVQLVPKARMQIDNSYFKAGLRGSSAQVFTRKIVKKKLDEALRLLPPSLGILIFDAYRSLLTQRAIFDQMLNQISATNADWTQNMCLEETRKFCAHPDEVTRFAVAPHNSGGAIDLTLTSHGFPVDMGTDFDDTSELAGTKFFEGDYKAIDGFTELRWLEVRKNRRILFNLMRNLGFTNYQEEWWHYDLGNCLWAAEMNSTWYFPSMEVRR